MPIDLEKLSKVLVDSGLLTSKELAEVKKKSEDAKISIEDVLVDDEYISDENLGQLASDIYNVPYVNLKKKRIDESVLRIVPELVAKRQKIITFARGSEGIKLAMNDPSNDELIFFIEKKTGEKVTPYYTSSINIIEGLQHYRKEIKEEFDDIIKENIEATRSKKPEDSELPVTRIIDTVLEYAYQNKASDIHIEPHANTVVIRFRIDGILHDVVTLPKDVHSFLITRIKIMSRLRTDEHRSAQDGRLVFETDVEKVDVRVSVIPVSDGEKAVLRLLSEKSRQFKLSELGLAPENLKILEKEFRKPHGMVLATGPTGSGKTTTLYAIIKILNKREVNISTIEDPVEYDIQGVNQIQVDQKTNLTFAKGLRSVLRQDPDIVMVGEIRDEDTADIAINAAMTGHLVLSTLHTNDAPTTLPRLLEMKIEPFLIATTVGVALAQRLVRKIHQGCIESFIPTEKDLQKYKRAVDKKALEKIGMFKKNIRLYRGKGCQLCHDTGFEGRIGIFEMLEMTDTIRQMVMKRSNSGEIRTAAIAEGMIPMLDDGLKKAAQGITTIEEVFRVITT
ncbi:type II/IV secretion system protein [Patescibacteria group bacterium]|nr:type II/IV secretion system protein [Patescibacteria group bacterium]